MGAYIQYEFRRAFFSKSTISAVILCILCMMVGAGEYLFNNNFDVDASYLFVYAYSKGTASILVLVAPILVCIPFAGSYLNDLNSGFTKYIYIRLSPVKYGVLRLVINGLLGGFVMAFSLTASFAIFVMAKGIERSDDVILRGTLANIYSHTQVGYILLIIFSAFIFGAVFSSLGLGLSTILKNKYLSVLAPFFYFMISGMFLDKISRYLNSEILYDISFYNDLSLTGIFLYDLILLVIGSGLFLTQILKKGDKVEA